VGSREAIAGVSSGHGRPGASNDAAEDALAELRENLGESFE